ncbi:esterase-like activity of phytase family protein [Acinetobacter sp. WZC-1]|uniref:esterase-like activity of phytase family protein n=1 Tax=Acinetobacter sp. WZC-1 TaxID=3459034 RepID=UPI00403DE9FE
MKTSTHELPDHSLDVEPVDHFYSKFAQGVPLAYEVMDIHHIEDAAKPGSFIEFRLGGFGSEISAHPFEKNKFYLLTDRGPNTTYDVNHDHGKIFLDPAYTPRIGLFELQEDGSIQKIKEILLKNPEGQLITGLPNRHFGATKEVAYDQYAKILQQGTDEFGLDSEGLVALKDGTFWVSDEYGPHLVHFDANGVEIDRINAYVHDSRRKSDYLLPAEYASRRPNRGMEGLTISPDQKKLIGIMQSAMSNPDASVNKSDLTRIVMIDLDTKAVSQYLYRQEGGADVHSNTAITALSATSFLVAERDDDFYKDNPQAFKRVYKISLKGATDLEQIQEIDMLRQHADMGVTVDGQSLEQYVLSAGWDGLAELGILPVTKTLVVDLVERLQYPHDKVEGLWIVDEQHLAVINDDDYAFTETEGMLTQKYLDRDQQVIDGNTLYIIDQLDLKPLP